MFTSVHLAVPSPQFIQNRNQLDNIFMTHETASHNYNQIDQTLLTEMEPDTNCNFTEVLQDYGCLHMLLASMEE